jgi:sterol-4alpha-carboxylate 3-dehydrogenase (decarboxylating)
MPSSDSYLIVGGGLLGGHIVDLLLQRGEKAVAVFDLKPSSFDSPVKVYQGDIADPDAVGKAIKAVGSSFLIALPSIRLPANVACLPPQSKVTCIIQTAAALPGQPRFVHVKVNIEGTKNVIEQAQQYGVRKFVWTSSASVVFDGSDQDGVDETYPYPVHPVDDYSGTKATAEQLVLAANGQKRLSTCSLRVAGLFGYVGWTSLLVTVYDQV